MILNRRQSVRLLVADQFVSGREDLNLRPLAPYASDFILFLRVPVSSHLRGVLDLAELFAK